MTSTTTSADGAEIAFDDTGGVGRPLVLVHGITESRRAWDPLHGALAEHWRVVRVDVRGHGDSERRGPYDPLTMAGDVAAVVGALALDSPLVVGHSMGGVVAAAYSGAGHPARGIVVVDQPLELAGFQDVLAPLRPMLEADDESFRAAVGMVFSALDGPLPSEERARLDSVSNPEREVVLGVWGTVFDTAADALDAQVSAILGGIRVPFLSLHGSDPGPSYGEWLRARVPQAQVEVWSDLGHYPHLLAPDRFVARLVELDPGG